MPGTFANTKSINMGDGLQTNVMSSNGVSAGAKVDNILNDLSDNGLDGITYNQSYDKPLTMVARKDGASYEIKTMPGEKGIELSISKIYSKAPTEADVLAEKSSRRLMFSDADKISNKKQILNRLEAERSQEAHGVQEGSVESMLARNRQAASRNLMC